MFTPTKWTHQFGAFAGLAGALAALTAIAIAPTAMRSPRNRALTAAGVFLVLGLSFSGLRLERKVEMYQWVQSSNTTKTTQTGGSETQAPTPSATAAINICSG